MAPLVRWARGMACIVELRGTADSELREVLAEGVPALVGDADAVAMAAAYRPEDGEGELTGEESAEQDELPDDTEANRSE